MTGEDLCNIQWLRSRQELLHVVLHIVLSAPLHCFWLRTFLTLSQLKLDTHISVLTYLLTYTANI